MVILLHPMSTFNSPELVKRRAQEHFVRDTWKAAARVDGGSLVDSSFRNVCRRGPRPVFMVVKHNKTSLWKTWCWQFTAQIIRGRGEFHIHPQGGEPARL